MLLNLNKKLIVLLVSVISLITLYSCGPGKKYLAGASAYEDEEQMWNPAYRVYHISSSVTRFYFIIPKGDILYVRNPETRKYDAFAQISFQIIKPSGKTNAVTNSGVIDIKKEEDEIPEKSLIGYFDVKIPDGSFYYASIVLNDKLRKKQFESLLSIDKKNRDSRENFMITDSTNVVNFLDYISSGSRFKVSSERMRSTNFFITRYYPISDFPLPIYIERKSKRMDIVKDTTYIIKSDEFITLDRPGIYHIQKDTTNVNGLTILILK